MSFQFETMIQGAEPVPARDTFLEAWGDMYNHVKSRLASDNLSMQELETAMWIKAGELPIFFYDARDHAIEQYGWTEPLDN